MKKKKVAYTLIIAMMLWFAGGANASAKYVVKPGDTLIKISKTQFGSGDKWKAIAELNNIKPPYHIHAGQTLLLPPGSVQESEPVEDGDDCISQITEIEADEHLSPLSFIIAVVFGFVPSIVSFKFTGWLFGVKTTLARCTAISFILYILMAVCCYTIVYQNNSKYFSYYLWSCIISLPILSVIACQKIFPCKWRQAIGIFLVSGLVIDLVILAISAVIILGLVAVLVIT